MRQWILLFLMLILLGCQSRSGYESYYTIDGEEWCLTDTAKFDVTIPQSGNYLMNICLRHTTDYEISNLWCFVQGRDSLKQIVGDTINIKVAETDGRWIGQGSSIKTIEQPFNKKIVQLPAGEYTFTIEQAMRVKCLKGVKDIGLKIQPLSIP